jgi:NAD(P)-dependent dehydrogenase (short-subunit alcohol dehydrogenase family)
MYQFKSKIAVVTGAGRGIGKVVAMDLIAEGVKVYIPDLDLERARATAKLLGPSAIPAKLDVSNVTAVRALFRQIKAETGGIDFLVNCAGGYKPRVPTLEITEAEFDMVLDSNLKGTFLCCTSSATRHIWPTTISPSCCWNIAAATLPRRSCTPMPNRGSKRTTSSNTSPSR